MDRPSSASGRGHNEPTHPVHLLRRSAPNAVDRTCSRPCLRGLSPLLAVLFLSSPYGILPMSATAAVGHELFCGLCAIHVYRPCRVRRVCAVSTGPTLAFSVHSRPGPRKTGLRLARSTFVLRLRELSQLSLSCAACLFRTACVHSFFSLHNHNVPTYMLQSSYNLQTSYTRPI